MASLRDGLEKLHQGLIQHQDAARGYVFRKLFRVIGPVDVDVALEGIDPRAGIEARFQAAEAQDTGGHQAPVLRIRFHVLPAFADGNPSFEDHSRWCIVAMLGRNDMQSPWGSKRALLTGEGTLAEGNRIARNAVASLPVV